MARPGFPVAMTGPGQGILKIVESEWLGLRSPKVVFGLKVMNTDKDNPLYSPPVNFQKATSFTGRLLSLFVKKHKIVVTRNYFMLFTRRRDSSSCKRYGLFL